MKYYITIFVLPVLVTSCIQLQSGFIKLSGVKNTQIQQTYGQGDYYRFVVRGSELRETDPDNYIQYGKIFGVSAMKILVPKYMEENRVCEKTYEIIEDSINHYEGGSASIYVRCK